MHFVGYAMIYGIGSDIVAIARVARIWGNYGESFAARILAEDELAEFRTSTQPARFLAKRFAAKEAFAKAAGTGLRSPVSLRNISVAHSVLGRPELRFQPALADWLQAQGIRAQHLSISDETDMALAYVVLES